MYVFRSPRLPWISSSAVALNMHAQCWNCSNACETICCLCHLKERKMLPLLPAHIPNCSRSQRCAFCFLLISNILWSVKKFLLWSVEKKSVPGLLITCCSCALPFFSCDPLCSYSHCFTFSFSHPNAIVAFLLHYLPVSLYFALLDLCFVFFASPTASATRVIVSICSFSV